MIGRAVEVWLVMLAAAVANGALRELAITPRIGDRAGRIIGAVVGFRPDAVP